MPPSHYHHHHHHHHHQTFTLPVINISEFDSLFKPASKRVSNDWENGVKALDSIPGYRYGATFISSLRSNLVLSASVPPLSPYTSYPNTPTTSAFSHTASLPHPSPSPLSLIAPASMSQTSNNVVAANLSSSSPTTPASNTDEIPLLTYHHVPADDQDTRVAALKLIADSVAQQRQTAGRAIIGHPAVISAAVLLVALATHYIHWTTLMTTGMGVVMAGLLGVRLLTSPYIVFAEEINFNWLDGTGEGGGNGGLSNPATGKGSQEEDGPVAHKRSGSDGKNHEPIVIVSKWGEEIIGALVLRFVKKERKGYVRAYTVRLRYRRKGVGEGLLEEAVRFVWGKGGRGVEFDGGHANSKRVLPGFFTGVFERNERRTREKLALVVEAQRKNR